MEARHHLQLTSPPQNPAMILKPTTNPSLIFSFRSHLRLPFSTSRIAAAKTAATPKPSTAAAADQLKHDWLASLSNDATNSVVSDSTWVLGVDPDVSGALALLKPTAAAHVYDSPHLKVLVGKTIRRRLDAKSIVDLLTSLDAPIGSVAYVEQSTPFPQDGKQGWWSGGFGYGLWIGVLVGLGFNVVPVASGVWKKKFELTGKLGAKDESRRVASVLFPELSCELKRKKDHGRAEALLIAAYGKGMTLKSRDEELLCNPVEVALNGN